MMSSCMRQHFVFCVLTATYFCCSVIAVTQCYLPNLQPAYGDIPCSNSLPSICCPSDGICLSNGLCFTSANIVSRSSCTDDTWSSGVCNTNSYCYGVTPGNFTALTPCGGPQFCCGEGQDAVYCCSNNNGFDVAQGTVTLSTVTSLVTGAGVTAAGTGSLVTTTVSVTTTLTAASGTCSATSAGGANSQTNGSIPTAQCPSCSSREVAIGAGVGIPLAAALACSLILLLLRRKHDSRQAANAPGIPIQPSVVEPYQAAPGPAYPSGMSQFDPYPHSPGGVGGGGYVQPRDPVDPIPRRVVSPESDGGRYELGGHARRGQPPTYLSQGKN